MTHCLQSVVEYMAFQQFSLIPAHVAVIMDGNGRWAQKKNRPRVFGHRNGARRVRELVEAAGESHVKYLTLYAFSEENWNRPQDEVNALFKLLSQYLKSEIDHLHRNNVRLRGIGDRTKIPKSCLTLLEQGECKTVLNDGLQLTLALSYSARSDMVSALKHIAQKVRSGEIDEGDICESMIANELSTRELPNPDLLIRTSGEQRLSNFLLWELSYSELYFTEKHWPDFCRKDFDLALASYARRDRRFGTVAKNELSTSPELVQGST